MAKFQPGELVEIQDGKHRVEGVLVYEPPDEQHPCPICDDGACVAWTNVLRVDGKWAYHVAECRMRSTGLGRRREG